MPPQVDIRAVIDNLRRHSAFKIDQADIAPVSESFVIAFYFRQPNSDDVLRHEQEYIESSVELEIEARRKCWTKLDAALGSSSPLSISMLDFGK